MAYISKFTGKEVDDILDWATQNKGIQIDKLWDASEPGKGTTNALPVSKLYDYDLVFVHGYVDGSHIPNQGMLVFDPKLIQPLEYTGSQPDKHGIFSTTVFRGTPNEQDGAPIAIEVFLQDNNEWIQWQPCYAIGYAGTETKRDFRAQYVVGIRSIDPYAAS